MQRKSLKCPIRRRQTSSLSIKHTRALSSAQTPKGHQDAAGPKRAVHLPLENTTLWKHLRRKQIYSPPLTDNLTVTGTEPGVHTHTHRSLWDLMKRGLKKREWLYLRENTIKLYDFHACVWNRVMEEEHVCDRWWAADNASHGRSVRQEDSDITPKTGNTLHSSSTSHSTFALINQITVLCCPNCDGFDN